MINRFKKSLLPLEIASYCALFTVILVKFVFKMNFYYPLVLVDGAVLHHFGEISYFANCFLIAFLFFLCRQIYFNSARKFNLQNLLVGLVVYLRLYLAFVLCLVLMQNFKLWSLLIHTNLHDNLYRSIDLYLSGIFHLNYTPPAYLEDLYFKIYAWMFCIGMSVAAIYGYTHSIIITTATGIVALIGGMMYMILPAYGPFIYSQDNGHFYYATQMAMLDFSEKFRMSNGVEFSQGGFESPLGAMPSLHVAHSVTIAYVIFRINKWLGAVFIAAAGFIIAFSMITMFHYALDVVAGLLLSALCLYITYKNIPERI